jgi:hypothetical protein
VLWGGGGGGGPPEPGLRIRIHFIRIRIQHFRLNTNPDPGLQWQKKEKKLTAERNNIFLDQKLQFTYHYAYIKVVQVTIEVFSSPKITSGAQNRKIFYFSGSFLPSWIQMRIRIPNTDLEPDQLSNWEPDPQPWSFLLCWMTYVYALLRIRIRDPVSFWPLDPGWKKFESGIRDKHCRFTTLNTNTVHHDKNMYV